MCKLILIVVLFLIAFTGHAQVEKIGAADSLLLSSAWKAFVKAAGHSDFGEITAMSKDTVNCYCGTDSLSVLKSKWPATAFSEAAVAMINGDARLKRIVTSGKPSFLLQTIEQDFNGHSTPEKMYSLAFVLYKPNEFAPGHEGASMFFEFKKVKNKFIISGISTVP